MTGEQYKKAIAKLGLNQTASAKLFGVNETTCRRWISGKHSIPDSVAMTLMLMLENGISPDDLRKRRSKTAA
jgi:DNA-binding transcriptional regulator YdaS (Cro superfamily)